MKYHFENKEGWMNDPNGLVYFRGEYHAFFQHYPYATHWGQMHWGHATSTDLINWTEHDIALFPDQDYEDDGGCFSGSAIVKDDILYLFYTSVSHELGQTQSMAFSRDGYTFHKYEGNPIIKSSPLGDKNEFRDPKVFMYDDEYRMVLGAGSSNIGYILLYRSTDLITWEYVGEIISGAELGPCVECPDLFPLEDKYVLMFSTIKALPHRVSFIVGSFDGYSFVSDDEQMGRQSIEIGPDFYAPQSFAAHDGRRIVIGWMYNWKRSVPVGAKHVGAFTIPREMNFNFDQELVMMPIREARPYMTDESQWVAYDNGRLRISYEGKTIYDLPFAYKPNVSILEDVGVVEVFISGGRQVITTYFC